MDWEPAVVYVTLDVVSMILSIAVAAYFFRSQRAAPGLGYGALGVAFLVTGLGYLTVATSGLHKLGDWPALHAFRAGGLLFGAVVIFAAYLVRARGLAVRNLNLLAGVAALILLLFVALYLAPPTFSLPSPLVYLPFFRLVEAGLLFATSFLAVLGIHATRLRDLRVPMAFAALGMGRFTTALLDTYDLPGPYIMAYVLRLLGLGLLLSVIATRWPRASP